MKKRLLCTVLILFLCITSFIPLTAKADYSSGVWEYTYYEDGVRITAYNGASSSITIPSTIEGRPVLAIGTGAFEDEYQLVSVSIPSTVEQIQQNAFRNCKKLTSVTLPEKLEYLGSHAFYDCVSLTKITVNSKQITEVVGSAFGNAGKESGGVTVTISGTVTKIPNSLFTSASSTNYPRITSVSIGANVTSIGSSAFENCADLKTVTFASGSLLERIYSSAFRCCYNLTSINLPTGLERIDANAFRECKKLPSITLPEKLEYLGDHGFYDCEGLTKITVNSKQITEVVGSAFGNAGKDSGAVTVTISGTVTKIPNSLFTSASSTNYPRITSVTIGANVTSIGNSAFENCEDLKKVTIASGSKLELIGSSAFRACEDLTSINLPATVERINANAFRECESLSSITLPEKLEYLGDHAFYDCEGLTKITVNSKSITNVVGSAFGNAGEEVGGTTVTFSSTVTKIPGNLFTSASSTNYPRITSVSVGANVTSIGNSTFENCDDLKTVTFASGSKLESIGSSAFRGCVSLTSITLPEKLAKIMNYAFEDCEALTKVKFTGNAPTISPYAFDNVVATVYYPKGNSTWTADMKKDYGGTLTWKTFVQLKAPTLKASNVASTGKIKLTWNKVDGASKYQVYRATSKTGTYSLLKTVTGTSLTNTSATTGKTYYYKVRAVDDGGNKSDWSSIVSRACDLPRPEISISNIESSGKIKLTWKKIDGAIKYEVYRATSKDGTYSLLKTVTGTTLNNTSATAGKAYYYKVRAIHSNSSANSAYSEVKYRTCDLAQPTLTVKRNSSGDPKLTWDKVSGAVKYQVYMATSKNGTYKLLKTVTGTSLTHGSSVPGTTYYYKVRAVHSNSAANSAYSSVRYITAE